MRAAVLRSRARELCSVLRVRALSSSARTEFPDLDVEFDIVGQTREGRAIYLDSQARARRAAAQRPHRSCPPTGRPARRPGAAVR